MGVWLICKKNTQQRSKKDSYVSGGHSSHVGFVHPFFHFLKLLSPFWGHSISLSICHRAIIIIIVLCNSLWNITNHKHYSTLLFKQSKYSRTDMKKETQKKLQLNKGIYSL